MKNESRMTRCWLLSALLSLMVLVTGCVTPPRAAAFPGGSAAWQKYLSNNIRGSVPVDNGAASGRYRVIVRFVVDKTGEVTGPYAMNDPGFGMAAEAVRVIKASPRWEPAIENGQPINSPHSQPVAFQIEGD